MLLEIIELDFNSDEAIYQQLSRQIIKGIAASRLQSGDSLPSVRQLADSIGINMHTVNKAYALLRAEGYVQMDRRKGAVIAVDMDKTAALDRIREELQISIARAVCKKVTREDVHKLIDGIFDEFQTE